VRERRRQGSNRPPPAVQYPSVFANPFLHSFPHGYSLPSVPRAAFSHSASLGRPKPCHSAKASASDQLTKTAGCSAFLFQPSKTSSRSIRYPLSERNFRNEPTVTGPLPM